MRRLLAAAAACCLVGDALGFAQGANEPIPYAQDKPPGPPLSVAEAIAKMRVPPGFAVQAVAAEPDLVNPVAMAFDERGRVWVAESVEYPRKPAGVGRDRIKILEDSDGDGKADKITVFAEGLNIPSGIALGNGGAYVANAPDILFLKDTDGDDKADVREVLVTGFGRNDTHELPSCLTWGPDGWLYGLNGVFNHSTIVHQGKTHRFNCALWRLHPKSHRFELFSQGTSNPWGLEYNRAGDFFVTACVIDHLWHLTETGYYHRQSGAYPPFTWKIESIVGYKHQKAAYCGLCQYDAEVYPEEYRGKLFMGNIHGSCINVDGLERLGASYRGTARPDFLSANDAWFMPVVQKVGPDGCLWILDWYDRYHCYQDAGRDPKGIDRLRGRLYRVTFNGSPMAKPFNLRKRTDAELVELLGDGNVYFRRWARQLLIERNTAGDSLRAAALNSAAPTVRRLEALWTLAASAPVNEIAADLSTAPQAELRAWGIRLAASAEQVPSDAAARLRAAAKDSDPAVRVQAMVAAGKACPGQCLEVCLDALETKPIDRSGLLPRMAWKHMEPRLDGARLAQWFADRPLGDRPDLASLLPRIVDRLLADEAGRLSSVAMVASLLGDVDAATAAVGADCLETLVDAALAGRIAPAGFAASSSMLARRASAAASDPRQPPALAAMLLLGDRASDNAARALIATPSVASHRRGLVFRALLATSEATAIEAALARLTPGAESNDDFPLELLAALGRSSAPVVGERLVAGFAQLRPSLRPQALDLLSSRPHWSRVLLTALDEKRIPTAVVNVNQIRKMRDLPDAECKAKVAKIWGTIREGRNKAREQVVDHFEEVVVGKKGDAAAGAKVYARVCAQCHEYRGAGHNVGPKLDDNGRSSLLQLLSNILDPNLVIGKDYQARIVATTDGRVVTGLVQEDSPARVVLKVAGGKLETFNRSDIESYRESKVSLMPEDLEKQTTEQEFRDLVAYLLAP